MSAPGLTALLLIPIAVLGPAIAVLIRKNMRLGRGDRRGARRLAAFAFVSMTLADLFGADHTSLPKEEFNLLVQIVNQGLGLALCVWLLYLGLEPALRRHWPDALISWSRLLTGRFRDPLLGRDVLVGVLAGIAATGNGLLDWASVFLGHEPAVRGGAVIEPHDQMYLLFMAPCMSVALGLAGLFLLYLLKAVVRRTHLAYFLLFLTAMAVWLVGSGDPIMASIGGTINSAIALTVLIRFGLLAFSTFGFTTYLLYPAPLTLDWSVWYAGQSFAVLALFAAILVAAAYTSLGGKPLFGKALLD